ncbi:MAG TPA: G8 domain-containing protein [Gemmatimonadales bacterium]
MLRLFRRGGLLVVALGLALSCAAPDSTAPSAGNPPPPANTRLWSDPATWPGHQLPQAGDSVVIPAGVTIKLDTDPPPLHSLTIEGMLFFADRDINLTTGWILVDGTLRVGTEGAPYRNRAVITLTGSPGNADIRGVGNKMIGVIGTLDIHGEGRAGWTQLGASAAAGATSIDLKKAMGWRSGDRIVLASSDFDPGQAEEAVITAVTGSNITLQQPLRYAHFGQLLTVAGQTVDERAEVGLLSRNITIQGDTGSTPGYGGHIIVLQGATARIEGVELFQMGQRGHLARYPMHWHVAGDVSGQYFRNSSVWRTFSRCVTVHGTDNALVQNNVCYDHTGHGYFLEDGAETGNTIEGNLGLVSRIPQGTDRLLESDSRAATFWITNPDNTYRNNVAAGSKGMGFWCAFPQAPTGLSVGQPNLPQSTPLREFSGNVAHSNNQGGLHVDDGPLPDGTTTVTNYTPRVDPADPSSAPVVAHFTNFRAYKQGHRAVWLRGRNLELDDSQLADNGIGATFAASETFVKNTVFIGVSGAATRLPTSGLLKGYEFYDGRVGAENVTFVNYNAASSIPAGALGYNRTNAFPIDTRNFARNASFVNSNEVYIENPTADKDGDKAAVFFDETGDVSGAANQWIAANVPILLSGSCSYRAQWNAHICTNRFINLSVRSGGNEAVAPLDVVRDDAVSLTLSGTGNQPEHAAMSVIPGRGYTLQWSGAQPPTPRVYLNDAVAGNSVMVSLPLSSPPPKVIRDYNTSQPLGAVADLASLSASNGDKYFYDGGSGTLHLKIVVQSGRDWATIFVTP